jgi:hypothetical protein
MRQILVEHAGLREMIPYSDLVLRIETISMESDSFALAHMVGQISEEEDAAGRGMLSVIVVHKVGDMRPGDVLQPHERPAADKQDVRGVERDAGLHRVLPASLGRNRDDREPR